MDEICFQQTAYEQTIINIFQSLLFLYLHSVHSYNQCSQLFNSRKMIVMHQLSPIEIKHIQTLFSKADSLIISAGAGMGVDSGLPDFRGNQGMWRAYPELGKQRIDFTEIANPAAFKFQPNLAWGFYGHRLALYRQTLPHQGFHLLKQLAEKLALPYFVFTSNVDEHFQKAGFDPNQIYECHGSIHHLQCSEPCQLTTWSANELTPEIDHQNCQWLGQLPLCPHCGKLSRPNILMFNDYAWVSQRHTQQARRLEFFRSPQSIYCH